jgi:hypothetical protein
MQRCKLSRRIGNISITKFQNNVRHEIMYNQIFFRNKIWTFLDTYSTVYV